MLGKVAPVGPARHFGHQPPSRIGEGLAGPTVPIGGVAHGLINWRPSAGLALLHQFQCPQIVGSVARQHVHGGDQLGVGVHHDGRLVPVKPTLAALVPVAQLWVVHRQHPVLAHPVLEADPVISMSIAIAALALDVLEQQLSQQLRPIHYALPLDAVLRQFQPRLPRQFQQPVRVGH